MLCAGCIIHSHKHTIELVKYSRKCVCYENKELELQASLPSPEESPQDERLLLNHAKAPGLLATRGEFNLGPENRLECSDILCNKVLLSVKEIEKANGIGIRRGAEREPPC